MTLGGALCGQAAAHGFENDFDTFWRQIQTDYPYFAKKATDWQCVKSVYGPQAAATNDRAALIVILEHALDELYDPHATLNVNLGSSTRLIPSGLDVWAEWQGNRAIVTQLRPGARAERTGLRVGMEIVAMNGIPIRKAAEARLGRCLTKPDPAAFNWALLAVLAGRHDTPRSIQVHTPAGDAEIHPDASVIALSDPPGATWRNQDGSIGYIAIHNLGSTDTVALFNKALQHLRHTRGLILDLRDTPGGGSTDVAEPIMGRLIDRSQPYQRVAPTHGKAWTAHVQPRGPWAYKAPVVVLVSRWTGSMGEGMAIGLDGMHRGVIVGTKMAGLNGSVFTHHLAQSDINYTFPGDALAHLNGTPRENFIPPVLVDLPGTNKDVSRDGILDEGITKLKSLIEVHDH